MDIKNLISQMTLEEKASLCSGSDFWHTKSIERLGIPSIMMSDGPHGLRRQEKEADHLAINESIKAICFPTASALACSWDRELIRKLGVALGEECQTEDVQVILGPAVNIKRSPLCGRNFEYYSEDPYLSTELAKNHINGVQSQGIGTSIKHFAANNQEDRRMSVDAIVDERTLREIYLASFEGAVREAQPWTVMCAYNKLNGEYCSENYRLLTEILKNEWNHEGFVVSDWGAVNDRDKGIVAGLELQMPADGGMGDGKIVEAINNGTLSEEALDKALERLLKVIFKAVENKKANATYNKDEHHDLARRIARECVVLLKNEDKILPLGKKEKIAIVGEFAKKPRYQGGGSSHINPTKVDNAYDEIVKILGDDKKVSYAQGYDIKSDDVSDELIQEAKKVAKKADKVLLFIGLPERYESEGYDRKHLNIPLNHEVLVEEIQKVNKNVIVVLSNGAPIEMPWLGKVKGLVEGYLTGQSTGGAIADVLYGICNPCGKLAETFPKKLAHNPSYLNFPGEGDKVEYKEGVFVGYRYYDSKDMDVLFPFGYGLSYTTFEYSDLKVSSKEINDTDEVIVSVKVKNTGHVPGAEIVQLYVKDVESFVIRPNKELKEFGKVFLNSGEEKELIFTLNKRSFAYYNVDIKDWHVETGDFEILIGKSSSEIILKETIKVNSTVKLKVHVTKNTPIGDIMYHPAFSQLMGGLLGFLSGGDDDALGEGNMFAEMIKYMPIRAIVSFSQGAISEEVIDGIIAQINS